MQARCHSPQLRSLSNRLHILILQIQIWLKVRFRFRNRNRR